MCATSTRQGGTASSMAGAGSSGGTTLGSGITSRSSISSVSASNMASLDAFRERIGSAMRRSSGRADARSTSCSGDARESDIRPGWRVEKPGFGAARAPACSGGAHLQFFRYLRGVARMLETAVRRPTGPTAVCDTRSRQTTKPCLVSSHGAAHGGRGGGRRRGADGRPARCTVCIECTAGDAAACEFAPVGPGRAGCAQGAGVPAVWPPDLWAVCSGAR